MPQAQSINPPQIRPFGPRALLLSGGSQNQRLAWAAHCDNTRPQGFQEWIMGYDTLMLKFDQAIESDELLGLLQKLEDQTGSIEPGRHHELPIDYSGPDLDAVARHCQLSSREVIEMHLAANYSVRFLGFSPGFAYLDGLPDELACPRRKSPRKRMSPGALAIGGSHTGIYPAASPGGWNWIGHCHESLIDTAKHSAPFRLQPGDTIRFFES